MPIRPRTSSGRTSSTRTTRTRLDHYRASAQALANELGCSVLLHFYALPNFQHTNGTMMAAFIPAEENMPASRLPQPKARVIDGISQASTAGAQQRTR